MTGGIMGGGKSTTLLVAKYFCHLANALVITISGQKRAKVTHRRACISVVKLFTRWFDWCTCFDDNVCLYCPGRDFTDGTHPLSSQVQTWLANLTVAAAGKLQHMRYSASPSSSLTDLIGVAATHEDLALYVFEELIKELCAQKRSPQQSAAVSATQQRL